MENQESENKKITLREYSKQQGITYEAARKSFNLYKDKALKGHISYEGKTQLLDLYAVEFLKSKRKNNAAVKFKESESDKIQIMTEERENLLLKVISIQNEAKEEVSQKEAEIKKLQGIISKYQLALAESENHTGFFYKISGKHQSKSQELLSEYLELINEASKITSNHKTGSEAVSEEVQTDPEENKTEDNQEEP